MKGKTLCEVFADEKRTGPSINRHRSKQDYCTPLDFKQADRKSVV